MHPSMHLYYVLLICLFSLDFLCVYASENVSTEAPGLAISRLVRSLTSESVYNKDIRPYFGEKPVEINVKILVNDISAISEINMDFTIDFYIRQYWRDPRLAFTPISNATKVLQMGADFLKLIWVPDTFIQNSKTVTTHTSTAATGTTLIHVKPTGDILYSTRLATTANCPMDLKYFPGDRQNCKIVLESYGYTGDDILYSWAPGNKSFGISDNIFLPAFTIKRYTQHRVEQTIFTESFTQLVFDIHFERYLGYYMNQIYVPAFLIVVISWVPFWLDREDNHARVGIGVTTVLTMTTMVNSASASLPKVSYIKAIDIYLFMCFLMVFLSLIEYATIGFFESISKQKSNNEPDSFTNPELDTMTNDERRVSTISVNNNNNKLNGNGQVVKPKSVKDTAWIDQISRFLFPVIFIAFNVIYAFVFIFIINSGD